MPVYVAPDPNLDAFTCPQCGVFASQELERLHVQSGPDGSYGPQMVIFQALTKRNCFNCHRYTLWHLGRMVYPQSGPVPPPNPDLDQDIQDDYREASAIVTQSPRGAAALLRLCVQKLCKQLGEKGKNIDGDIAALVSKGLPMRIQQALDVVRVIGNEAVHPGEMDLKDDQPTALVLFALVNAIADNRITEPRQIDAIYQTLPKTKLEHIQKRDQDSKTQ